MRATFLAIAFAFTGIQCIETNCHPGPACDPNAQVQANANAIVGTDCGTFFIDHGVISNPNAAICAHNFWTQSPMQPFTFTFRAVEDQETLIDVYMASSQTSVMTLQATLTSDSNKVVYETCNAPVWVATGDVQDHNSPQYGNYQFQCTTYTNPNTLCNDAQVCD